MGFVEIATALLAHEHTLIDAQDMSHSTPLHVSAFAGNEHLTALLLERGANPNAKDLAGNTPLHRATLEGHVAVMRVLLATGAHADAAGTEGSTPLHLAALSAPTGEAQLSIAELLLSYGADAKKPNRHGDTASSLAQFQGRQRLASLLAQASNDSAAAMSRSSCAAAGSDRSPAAEGAAAASATALANSKDDFSFVLGCLQSPGLRRVLEAFHSSHHYKFRRLHGGDFPLELTALHSQFHGLVARHVERLLGTRGLTWDRAAAACERAVYEGRCSKERLRLLHSSRRFTTLKLSSLSCQALARRAWRRRTRRTRRRKGWLTSCRRIRRRRMSILSSSCRRVMLGTRMFERMR